MKNNGPSFVTYCKYILVFLALMTLVGMVVLPTFVKPRPGPAIWKCRHNLRALGRAMELYAADNGGRFPPNDKAGHWVIALNKWSMSKDHTGLELFLKCPSDTSRSISSFEINPKLAGFSVHGLSDEAKTNIPLLKEKPFPGSHKLIYYLNGHVGTSSASD